MGASDIYFTIGKQVTALNELQGYLERKQAQDREENGSQSGYSGDFQTVSGVKTDFTKVFTSFRQALDHCLEKTEKWGDALAVHYCEITVPLSRTREKIIERIKAMQTEIAQIKIVTKKDGFRTCTNCRSKLAHSHLNYKTCPLCNTCLLSASEVKKLNKKREQLEKLIDRRDALYKEEQTKAIRQHGIKNVKTLIAGWGAC
jgi:hypothetical protein